MVKKCGDINNIKYNKITLNNNLHKINNTIILHTTKSIADSGYTSHFFPTEPTVCIDIRETEDTLNVLLSNSQEMNLTLEGFLPIEKLSKEAQKTQMFENLRSALVSLGQLCDDGCEIRLHKDEIKIYKDKEVILRGGGKIREVVCGSYL